MASGSVHQLPTRIKDLKTQETIDECVVKDQIADASERVKRDKEILQGNQAENVRNFRDSMVKILIGRYKHIDTTHLDDVWGVVVDPNQIRLDDGLYREVTEGTRGYQIQKTIKKKDIIEWNEVMLVKDMCTLSIHVMKTTPLEEFLKYVELKCMLDNRIANLRPKFYAIYLIYPSVYLHYEFLKGFTLDKFFLQVMPKVKEEVAIPYVFHIWFIAAFIDNIKIIRSCGISHNDLTEGNIMIVLGSDMAVNVMFIDFEISSTLKGSLDIPSMVYIVRRNYLQEDLLQYTKELPGHISSRIFKILYKINEITNNIEDELTEDLNWVLNEIDGDHQHRMKMFSIIQQQYYEQTENPDIDLSEENRIVVGEVDIADSNRQLS